MNENLCKEPKYLPKNGLSRASQILPFLPFGNATLWAWSKCGKFPAPVKVSPTITAWKNEEVLTWLEEQGLSGQNIDYESNATQCRDDDEFNFVNHPEFIAILEQEKLKLASKSQIVDNTVGFSQVTGVYFLIKDKEIVYIGQSINCPKRVAEHIKDKDFDDFTVIKCDISELNILETLYILKFEPKLNKVFSGKNNLQAKFTSMKVEEIIARCKKVS